MGTEIDRILEELEELEAEFAPLLESNLYQQLAPNSLFKLAVMRLGECVEEAKAAGDLKLLQDCITDIKRMIRHVQALQRRQDRQDED